jgi:predicted NAD/FAD-binding protein
MVTPSDSPPAKRRPTIAVVGSGIAGLSAAWHLKEAAQVTVFDSETRAGGHAHTVDVTLAGKTFGVDTGFLVFNHRTYPGLTPFFDALGVVTAPSDMGFSVQAHGAGAGNTALEWAGNSLNSVFSQRRNLLRPAFWGMLAGIVRFNAAATAYAQHPPSHSETLGEYLAAQGYSAALRDWYLVPMAAAIWSCPTATMMGYPMATFARFCHNHGLLQISQRPQWYTVQGGSRHYVDKVLAALPDVRLGQAVHHVQRDAQGVSLVTAAGLQRFDGVVMACHSDQALALLTGTGHKGVDEHAVNSPQTRPSAAESAVLGAIRYQTNTAVLHTDASVLPSQRRCWAAWNYETQADAPHAVHAGQNVCLHYLLNKLQPLPVGDDCPVIVSLNPLAQRPPAARAVLRTFAYAHPVFDGAAIAAQAQIPSIQGDVAGLRTWFAGAWTNYGFHEDGFQSGKTAARSVMAWLAQP